MKRLEELINRLKGLEEGVLRTIEEAVKKYEGVIVEMTSEDQLYERGVNREGVSIASYRPYRPFTIRVKRQKGQPTDRVTLKDTGDFHESFYLIFYQDGFEIAASDEKTNKLVLKYGEAILGLTDENFVDLAVSYIEPEIRKYFNENL